MQKIIIIVLVVLLLIYLSTKLFINKSSPPKTINQNIKDQSYILEIANNSYLQAKGLSNRSELCSNCGMLFVFNGETIRYFWMKDTLISLDMIFVTQSGQVTDIFTAKPEPNVPDLQLKLYQSSQAVKYVIELNAGTAQKIKLKIGDSIKINYGN
ncbi:MAG: DUF192 domain-containing protein [Candidatus Shapirobacteria bacterium]|jgi:hypothetical protein